MYLLLLCIFAVGAAAQTFTPQNPFSNCTLTIPMVNQAIERIKTDKEYLPSYVADPIINANDEEKQQFVTFVNELMSGKFADTPVTNLEQFLQLIKEKAPLIYAKGVEMHKAFVEKVNGLNEEAKQFVLKWMNKWAEMIRSLNKSNAFQATFDFNKQFFTEANKLSEGAKNSLKQQFPECAKAWKDRPQLAQFAKFMINAANSTDSKQEVERKETAQLPFRTKTMELGIVLFTYHQSLTKFLEIMKLMNNATTPTAA